MSEVWIFSVSKGTKINDFMIVQVHSFIYQTLCYDCCTRSTFTNAAHSISKWNSPAVEVKLDSDYFTNKASAFVRTSFISRRCDACAEGRSDVEKMREVKDLRLVGVDKGADIKGETFDPFEKTIYMIKTRKLKNRRECTGAAKHLASSFN